MNLTLKQLKAVNAFREFVKINGTCPTDKEWAAMIGCHPNALREMIRKHLIPRGVLRAVRPKNFRRRYELVEPKKPGVNERLMQWCKKARAMFDKAGIFSVVEELDEILQASG